ncbi:hypothetical protein LGW51_09625 [Streptococcus mutans]|jgi:hypothetical protein|uniref:Uncharacterized protein n=1 Tax=Streptococcus mutans serotype c (strain ATCC 700610 / UA159) TaxID=210007 RepID=Q8DW61_STRMU|nr:hypothetical protein [Streptococcus mutans]AAN57986.1 hypothetical protein SMU_214c [Streptococcus mutans UA159]AJD54653.1 hypothetical protein SMUFR_0178 [Streptococcus mutans UA159-FR]ARS61686.1 hypothetical protein RO10_00110 [Streptococcus mutans]EMB84090.1 hypothetical protein SMU54_07852 [Streptococcus mutans A9]EMC18238.1 hypothetical protein SMU77_04090 [Streptococcus mutans NV1996]
MDFKEKVKLWFNRYRLRLALKNASKNNYISFHYDSEGVIFVQSGKRYDTCFGLSVSDVDLAVFEKYIVSGEFLVYQGIWRSPLVDYILRFLSKWGKVDIWRV